MGSASCGVVATFGDRVGGYLAHVEHALDARLPPAASVPASLHRAMRYAVLGGGKRVRPLLCYATAETLAIDPAAVDDAACAVELIHAFSLIHDDLPAMDDDALRRGRPTTHKAFGVATAILAGDATTALLDRFAGNIGLAFQIRDDLLDVEGDTAVIGKQRGADAAHGKSTYPALLGAPAARARADALYADALAALEPLGADADPLRWMAAYIVHRDR
jgi:farnesyl diphosphate synthase